MSGFLWLVSGRAGRRAVLLVSSPSVCVCVCGQVASEPYINLTTGGSGPQRFATDWERELVVAAKQAGTAGTAINSINANTIKS